MFGYPLPRWLIVVALLTLGIIPLALLSLAQKTVTVVADGAPPITFNTQASTVGGAVASAGIALYPEDILQPAAASAVQSGQTITLHRALPVQVTDGGVSVTVRTHQKKIAAILTEAGYTLAAADAVYADGVLVPPDFWNTPGAVPLTLNIRRAMTITVMEGGKLRTVLTSALTVGQALADAGIAVYAADATTPPLATPLTPGMTVALNRAAPVSLEVDGHTLQTRSRRGTVSEVLADAGVALVGLDYTVPDLTAAPPTDGSPIRVVRVVEQIVTEQKPMPYPVQYQPVADLDLDSTKLVQGGVNGAQASRVRVRLENGLEVSRTTEDQWVLAAPQPRIIGYGTRIVLRTVDTPNGPVEYWRAVQMRATSYSASRSGASPSSPWYGHTRSGKVLTVGMVAVDLNVMPLGTRLYIPGYGKATAEDTGGGVKGKWVDLGYDDWNYVSWHGYVTVYFVTPVPPADQIKWVLP